MAIASSGALAISDISSEFGGSGARSLSDYYAGDGLVASLLTDSSGNAVPSSGTIKFSDFYTTAKFVAGSFTTLSGNSTATVPTGANAIHIQFAVAGGGGGCGGGDYDGVGVESAGAGGGSGAYISDKVFTVVAGETITFAVGSAGSGVDISAQMAAQGTKHVQRAATFNSSCQQIGGTGGTTSASGSSTGAIFTLTGGGGGKGINGDVAGPARTNIAGTAGDVSHIDTGLTGTFTNASNVGANLSTLTSGPRSTFNQSGAGAVGGNNGNCSGDNCRIGGSTGGASYASAISGGTGGSSSGNGTPGGAGTRGSGGGGGAAQVTFPASQGDSGSTDGGNGGAGEIKFRFVRKNA
jgi:hypothetical protein